MEYQTETLFSQRVTVTHMPMGYQVFRPGFGPPNSQLPQCVIACNGWPIRTGFTYPAALKFVEEALKESDRQYAAHQRKRFSSGGKKKPRSKRAGRKK